MKGMKNMYNIYNMYQYPYYFNVPRYNSDNIYNIYDPYSYYGNTPMYNADFSRSFSDQYIPYTDELEYDARADFWQSIKDDDLIPLKDYGPEPFVVDIEKATKQNKTFRTALWTGPYLQLTLMSIKAGEDIGLEIHPDHDQFIRIEEGQGIVRMGDTKDSLNFEQKVYDDFAIIIPAGKWHNLINTGDKPLKLYSIYAPPEHPSGTVHETKAIAEAAEAEHHH